MKTILAMPQGACQTSRESVDTGGADSNGLSRLPSISPDGDWIAFESEATDLVPGDVILLDSGAAVPADARVLAGTELKVNEAPLTGESLPVSKSSEPATEENGDDVPLAERTSMLYKGTLVASGSGRAVVTATGAAVAAALILGWDWRLAVAFGALVIVTGPTVITPLLRRIKVEHSVETVLEAREC